MKEDSVDEIVIEVLGTVQARRHTSIDLGAPMQRKMLAALALEARALSRDELVDILWDRPPSSAVNVVRTYASRLRSVLNPLHIDSVGDGYALRDYATDVMEFERYADSDPQRALRSWRGIPLSGLAGRWVDEQRSRLDDRWIDVTEEALARDVADRRRSVTAELASLCARYPLRERLRSSLMRALYLDGRQSDAIAEYVSLRSILNDELGVLPSFECAGVYQQIIDGTLTSTPSARPSTTTPAQLPADLPTFFGRRDVIERLCDPPVSVSAPPMWVVSGLGGVGKTALAVHVAHRLRSRYPDGQLMVDLRGSSAEAADPTAVLRQFLVAFGISTIPDGVDERAALFRSVLADRQVLVVLDNARDCEQVTPLLPGSAACAVLITSRSRSIDLVGAQSISLDVLAHADALDLFSAAVGRTRTAAEPTAAATVVSMCGELPLAVRIVAARLSARPGWSIATLRDRLSDSRNRLSELRIASRSVTATFALAHDLLDEERSRAFRMLSVADTPTFDVRIARIVLDTSERAAEDLCEQLVDVGLLAPKSPGHYGFHDLVREYGYSVASPSERRGVIDSIAGDWLSSVRNAAAVTGRRSPEQNTSGLRFADHEHAQRWLDQEASCLADTLTRHGSLPLPIDTTGSSVVVAHALSEMNNAVGAGTEHGLEDRVRSGLIALGRGDDLPEVQTALRALGTW